MTEQNKINIVVRANMTKKKIPTIEGMVALKKIQNFSYALSDDIGLGCSSKVYKGKDDNTNQTVAIKVIEIKNEDDLHLRFLNEEIRILQLIKQNTLQRLKKNQSNLLYLENVFKTKNNVYIITEFCQGKDMSKILRNRKKFNEIEAQSIMKQLLQGYEKLYELQIVHRDLKLANIFIKRGVVKLADFGFAISASQCDDKFDYNVGSPYYMPPQSLRYNRYSYKSDIWSLGIIAYELIYGKLPWKEKVDSILFQKITSVPIQTLFDPEIEISELYKQFILQCLRIDIDKRVTPQFVIEYKWQLAVDWVEGICQPAQIGLPIRNGGIPPAVIPTLIRGRKFINNQEIQKQKIVRNHSAEQKNNERNSLKPQQNLNQTVVINEVQTLSRQKKTNQISNPQLHHGLQKMNRLSEQEDSKIKQVSINQDKNKIIQPPQLLASNKLIINENQNINILKMIQKSDEKNVQFAILGQLYFCKFLAEVLEDVHNCHAYDFIDKISIKSDIIYHIISKIQILFEMCNNSENILQIEGFLSYLNNERWNRLKNIIIVHYTKYMELFLNQTKINDQNDIKLKQFINHLSIKLPQTYWILQNVTYYYQLKLLIRQQNCYNFALTSKIDLLLSNKNNNPNHQIIYNSNDCNRIIKKLKHLGII